MNTAGAILPDPIRAGARAHAVKTFAEYPLCSCFAAVFPADRLHEVVPPVVPIRQNWGWFW